MPVGTGATDIINNIDGLGVGGLSVMNMLLSTTPGQIILVGIGFTILAIVLGGFFYLLSLAKAKR